MHSDRGPGLVEASTYIQAFADKLVVVKLGGELLDGGPVIERIIPQVAVLYRCGLRPIIVHGGGRQVDEACEAAGIERVKHRGRRVTTPDVMEVMLEVVASRLNRSIVDRLRREGVPAVGFAEGMSEVVRCVRREPTVEGDVTVDWGFVGDVVDIDAEPLMSDEPGAPWAVPVLPSIGHLEDETPVNVNADSVASRLAMELDSIKLVLMTGVPGIMESPHAAGPISRLSMRDARALVDSGVAAGGMRAKVEEALRALDGGVPRVHIISGREPMTLIRELFTHEGCGTLIVPEEGA